METRRLPTLGRAVFCGRVTHPLLLPKVPASVFLTLLAKKNWTHFFQLYWRGCRVGRAEGIPVLASALASFLTFPEVAFPEVPQQGELSSNMGAGAPLL